jgi:fructose-1,6-bisphosphatase/inositol monophosphatase family enzyme
VSDITTIESAVLSLNGMTRMREMAFADRVLEWTSRFWSVRSMGGTPDAMMLAAGQLEIWIEPRVAPWDLAAPQVILEEAGAVFFDLSGKRTIYGGSAAACVPALEHELRAFLGAAALSATKTKGVVPSP